MIYNMNRTLTTLLLVLGALLLIQCKEDIKTSAQSSVSINTTGIESIDLLTAEIQKFPLDASL